MALVINLAVALLAILVIIVLRIQLLRLLWKPRSKPDWNQHECLHGCGDERLDEKRHSPSGKVRTIRLTDDGEFVCRCEFTDAIYEIRNGRHPELVVWYVHGWKHNANKSDSDFGHFKELIEDLTKQQAALAESERRRVIGIYVGWDGAIGPRRPWPLPELTFWNRKRAADRISQSAVMTKIIAATNNARQQFRQREGITASDVTIMIGHSFGARILYTATSQVLIDEIQRQHPGFVNFGYGVVDGPVDLILLLNPAFEASIFTAMHTVSRPNNDWEASAEGQAPLMLVLSTENDWATGTAFPWGQWLDLAHGDRQYQTLGNYKGYITHRLERAESRGDTSADGGVWYDAFAARPLRLVRNANSEAGNPVIVARTSADIIDNHNGIWGEELRKWLIAFLSKQTREVEIRKERTISTGSR